MSDFPVEEDFIVEEDFTVEELVIPTTVGAEGWEDYVAMCEVRNALQAEAAGTRQLALAPEELLPHWHDPDDTKRVWVARVGADIVGRGLYSFAEGDTIAGLDVQVLPSARRRGIGAALYTSLVEAALGGGKTVFQTGFLARDDPSEPRISSPSGFGSVASKSPGVRFAVARGFELQIVARHSQLLLPADTERVDRLRRDALAVAGADYRVIRWSAPTPEEWIDDVAVLHGRMFTDAPHGDLDMPAEEWTADRVRNMDAVHLASGRGLIVSAAEHIPSGQLVAFTELDVPAQTERPVTQRATLVRADHRGHRLGMLLKADNIQALTETHAGHPSIQTDNAEENRFMLDVNESLGFEAVFTASGWKREAGQ